MAVSTVALILLLYVSVNGIQYDHVGEAGVGAAVTLTVAQCHANATAQLTKEQKKVGSCDRQLAYGLARIDAHELLGAKDIYGYPERTPTKYEADPWFELCSSDWAGWVYPFWSSGSVTARIDV